MIQKLEKWGQGADLEVRNLESKKEKGRMTVMWRLHQEGKKELEILWINKEIWRNLAMNDKDEWTNR